MNTRTALVRYTKGTLSMTLALIFVVFGFSHFALGDPWASGGSCYAHPALVQTCHATFVPSRSTVTFTRVRSASHSR